MSGDDPNVPKGFCETAGAISVELIADRNQHLRASCNSSVRDVVNVFDLEVEHHGRTAEVFGPRRFLRCVTYKDP